LIAGLKIGTGSQQIPSCPCILQMERWSAYLSFTEYFFRSAQAF
jgi:hypothetical protein